MPDPSFVASRPAHELGYADSRFERFAGIDVHHEVHGPHDAPAVLFSHHFYGSVRTWGYVMADLADDHLVTAFDRPGSGLTERPPRRRWNGTNPYTREVAATIGWELLDHIGVDRAVLVGSSAGGTNVLEMYRLAPHRVRGLVLVSPAITGDVGPPSSLRPLLRSSAARTLARPVARRLAADMSPRRISRSWHDGSRATDEHAEPYQRMLQVEGWERGFWDLVTAEPPPDLRTVVRSVAVPTLVVAGASDRVIAAGWNRRTAAAITGAEFALLEECGHTPHEECPDALLHVMRPFLDRLDDA